MIHIKMFPSPKKSGSIFGSSTTNIVNNTYNQSEADKWFYFNPDANAVVCKFDFYSVGSVSANGMNTEGSEAGQLQVEDNLESTSTTKALSANQGRVLKNLIDNIETSGGGGQVLNTCDWSNVTNKPATYTPAAHTHSQRDINGLDSRLSAINSSLATVSQNLESHVNDQYKHLTHAQRDRINRLLQIDMNKLEALLNLIEVDSASDTITVNGNIFAENDVTASAN